MQVNSQKDRMAKLETPTSAAGFPPPKNGKFEVLFRFNGPGSRSSTRLQRGKDANHVLIPGRGV